jgi:hypothetical protein
MPRTKRVRLKPDLRRMTPLLSTIVSRRLNPLKRSEAFGARLDRAPSVNEAEQEEADGLVELAELLTLLRLRAERSSDLSGIPMLAK